MPQMIKRRFITDSHCSRTCQSSGSSSARRKSAFPARGDYGLETASSSPRAFTLLEMMAIVVILGVVATMVVIRVGDATTNGNREACYSYKGDIEVQVQRWWRATGGPPDANLANIYADTDYFPEGGYTCPVDGTSYTIDTTTGEVVGHTH